MAAQPRASYLGPWALIPHPHRTMCGYCGAWLDDEERQLLGTGRAGDHWPCGWPVDMEFATLGPARGIAIERVYIATVGTPLMRAPGVHLMRTFGAAERCVGMGA